MLLFLDDARRIQIHHLPNLLCRYDEKQQGKSEEQANHPIPLIGNIHVSVGQSNQHQSQERIHKNKRNKMYQNIRFGKQRSNSQGLTFIVIIP